MNFALFYNRASMELFIRTLAPWIWRFARHQRVRRLPACADGCSGCAQVALMAGSNL